MTSDNTETTPPPETESVTSKRALMTRERMKDINVWMSVETACENGLAQDATCEELYDDIRAFIALFPGTHSEWRFIIDSYPSLANTKIRITIQEALAKN